VTDEFDGHSFFEEDPQTIGYQFFSALLDQDIESLELLVTPESRPAWGNFGVAIALLHALDNPGMMQEGIRAQRDPDVCYMRVLRGVQRSHEVTDYVRLDDPLLMTLVWRPEFGRWMVHHFGDAVEPSSVPRGS
jgi:hypothetical protein